MDQGKAQKKATDLAIIIKTWNPWGELVKSRNFWTHDLGEIETSVTRHPVLNSQPCLTSSL